MTGELPDSTGVFSEFPVSVVPGLAYREDVDTDAGQQLEQDLINAAQRHWGAPPDIWHWHNHSLGKNVHAPDAVYRLATEQSSRLLLQMHDFAEDGRPDNYRRQRSFSYPLYPQAAHIHYAVLNGRDASILQASGWPRERLHLLANAVAIDTAAAKPLVQPAGFDRLFLYPTRAIRRKNLGEICLHAMAAESGDGFATTLLPSNPEWQSIHADWQRFAFKMKLPIRFGVGEYGNTSFEQWIASSYALVTTSIAEGFGLAFLEPFLFDKPIRGRKLTEITRDFEAKGLDLSELYSECRVPREAVDLSFLRDRITRSLEKTLSAFGLPPDSSLSRSILNSMVNERGIEFGRLDEPLQQSALFEIRNSRRLRSRWRPPSLTQAVDQDRLQRNKACIEEHYGLKAYGRRLYQLYSTLLSCEACPLETLIEPQTLVREFLSPERYNLLRD